MIKSMTGYGSGSGNANGKEFTVEIRAVNHRYSDFNIKCPRIYAFSEEHVRKKAAETVSRGKVDIYISVENKEAQGGIVKIDTELARGYADGLSRLSSELGFSC